MNKPIYELAIEKLPAKDISKYCSDLYLAVSKESSELIADYKFKENVTVFLGSDNRNWYDIPFAYLPFWERCIKKESKKPVPVSAEKHIESLNESLIDMS